MRPHDGDAPQPSPATAAGTERSSNVAVPATNTDDSDLEKGDQPPISPPSDKEEDNNNNNNSAYIVGFEDDDPENPKNWNKYYKAFITVQLGLLAMAGSMAASIVAPAEPIIAQELGVSREVAVLMVALFILGESRSYCHGTCEGKPTDMVYSYDCIIEAGY